MFYALREALELRDSISAAGVSIEDFDQTASRPHNSLNKVVEYTRDGQTGSIALPLNSKSAPEPMAICGKVMGETIELCAVAPLAPIQARLKRHVEIRYAATARRQWGAVEVAETLPI